MLPVGVLEPDQAGAAGDVDVALEAADVRIMLELHAFRLKRSDDRVELVPDAPHYRIGAVVPANSDG